MSRVATFLTHLALYVSFLVASAGAQAQGSTLSLLVGEWNHVGSGSVGGHNILVRSTGNNTADVFQSNAPMARVAGGVIQAGGNFAFEGRDNQGKSYRCVYYITFYADRLQSNWRVTARAGNFKCPEGLYARIAAAGDPRLPEADLIRLAQLVRQNRPDVLTADDGEKLVLLRTSLRVTQGALERFFRVLGEDNVPPEKLAEKLEQKAQAQQQLIQQANALNPDDPAIKVLRDQALAAIDAGRYDEAKIRLARASEADLAAIRRLQGVAEKRLLSAAEAKASLGRIALIESQYRQAATYFRAAFDLAPANHTEVRRNHRMGEADAWYRQGDEKGDNDALGRAISLNQEVLRETPRARAPLDWAGVQNELGIALWTLGQREGGATRLEEAVAAFREASKERTRERVPLDWARTQNNLGIALLRLGERESGSARLEDAVGALREALTERTRERVPLDWATTQTNLGIALLRLGERDSGVGRLEEALAAFRATLSVYTRERDPLGWATTQNNLGLALKTLGERESGTARLEAAVAAHHEALKEYTRERVPLYWAMTQTNLGNALETLGERESGAARLEQAVAAYGESLQEYTRERVPLDWAATQTNLGNALLRLGERERGTARLEAAVASHREALKERTRERVPLDWAATQTNLGDALLRLGERERGTARLEAAIAAHRAALQELTRERAPLDWATTQTALGNALRTLGERENGTTRLEEAVAAFHEALQEGTRERVPLDWATAETNLGIALAALGERESGTVRLEAAVAAFHKALQEGTRERVPLGWATTQNYLGTALRILGERESSTARLEQAVTAYKAALSVFEPAAAEFHVDATKANLVRAEVALAATNPRQRHLDHAIAGDGEVRLDSGNTVAEVHAVVDSLGAKVFDELQALVGPAWQRLVANAPLLAAMAVVIGAGLAMVRARLLLLSILLLLATPSLAALATEPEMQLYMTKWLRVGAVVGGTLGIAEVILRRLFGRQASAPP